MESISSEGEGVSEEAADELKEKEGSVDGDHDLDTGRLGPQRLGGTHGEDRRAPIGARDGGWLG